MRNNIHKRKRKLFIKSNNPPVKRTFIEWVKDHVTISSDFHNPPDEIAPYANDSGLSIKKVLNRLVVYIGFKFKF